MATVRSDPDVTWWLYFMATANHRIYTGISPDPVRRFAAHTRRQGAHTRMNKPIALLGATPVGDYAQAVKVERWAKRLSGGAKEALALSYRASPEWAAIAEGLGQLRISR